MTGFLVGVRTATEVALAARAAADLVEYTPEAFGSHDLARVQAIRAAWPGRLRLRLPDARGTTFEFARAAQADECALPLDAIGEAPRDGLRLVALVSAGRALTSETLVWLSERAEALMLVVDPGASIFKATDIAALDVLASRCAAARLGLEIGGHIEAPDIARLLLLSPRVLGCGGTIRSGPDDQLDADALETMRGLIPAASGDSPIDIPSSSTSTDRIFVRDFVVETSIGAYSAEHRGDQRVRFDVEIDVARPTGPPRDMRDVFSYDIIIETIRVLARRGHVLFVETLAEEVAERILAYPAVRSAMVRVSKLDVIDGTVGIEIHRDRQVR